MHVGHLAWLQQAALLQRLPEAGQVGGGADQATGRVVDWQLVQPLGRATVLPGWFALRDGLVRPRPLEQPLE